jgi:hypothetical protein
MLKDLFYYFGNPCNLKRILLPAHYLNLKKGVRPFGYFKTKGEG